MDEEFSGDEVLLLVLSIVVAVAGLATWFRPLARVAALGSSRNQRLLLWLVPIVCLGVIWFVLASFAASEVRHNTGYTVLFVATGAAWLTVARGLFALLGISFRDDALERNNPAATMAICGAMLGVTFTYAGANIGEGPTVWTTIYPGLMATACLLVFWLSIELTTHVSLAVTEDRDLASGLRLAGFLTSVGLILGRAVAGDWESAVVTVDDFVRDAWPVLLWVFVAVIAEDMLRPTPERPFPSVVKSGLVPALSYLLAAVGYLLWLGPWNSVPQ
jgi:uncharacterized membrane protein YjfL (UPF0719 family)